jgi:hypothetical protein
MWQHFHVEEHDVLICRSQPDDFLLMFNNAAAAEKVILPDPHPEHRLHAIL